MKTAISTDGRNHQTDRFRAELGVQMECIIDPEFTDTFGHLNNSAYARYFELGRKALQENHGMGDEMLKDAGMGLWVRDSYISRILQVKANQEIEVHSRFLGYKGIMIYMTHKMIYDGRKAATAITEHYMVKLGKEPIAIEIPKTLTAKLASLLVEKVSLTGLTGVVELVEKEERARRMDLLSSSNILNTERL